MKRYLILSLAVLVALAGLGVGPLVWTKASAHGHLYSPRGVPAAPVGLVFGAGVFASGQPTPFLRARLDLAVDLYRRGQVQVLLVSGDNRTHRYDEPTAMRDYLVGRGVPEARIVRDFGGRNTYDSCKRAHEVFGVRKAILVSQAYHMPRAVAVCRALGIDANGVGDITMQRAHPRTYRSYEERELRAQYKAAFDVLRGRPAGVSGGKDDSVQRALS